MEKLSLKLSSFTISDALKAESDDRQFKAIELLIGKISSKDFIFPLIICNALVGYQLSWTWEEYWEEFAKYAIDYKFPKKYSFEILYSFFKDFLPKSKCNKRLLNMKIPRLKKAEGLLGSLSGNEIYYYENLLELQLVLSKEMHQDKGSKTILFAIKMFIYAARIFFAKLILAPKEIWIPLDSRLAKIEAIYNTNNLSRQKYWEIISEEIWIPRVHLDAILWTKCNEYICNW